MVGKCPNEGLLDEAKPKEVINLLYEGITMKKILLGLAILIGFTSNIVADGLDEYKRACADADARGCYHLALVYAEGDGVKQNVETAKSFLQFSCAEGFFDACGALQDLTVGDKKTTSSSTVAVTDSEKELLQLKKELATLRREKRETDMQRQIDSARHELEVERLRQAREATDLKKEREDIERLKQEQKREKGLVESYTARIGIEDHYSSRGTKLEGIAAIIRQDRANYHKFLKRDLDDTGDNFFASKSNRAILERMLESGSITMEARSAILYDNPLIEVRVYNNHIEVELK